jgi:hypothetical protein
MSNNDSEHDGIFTDIILKNKYKDDELIYQKNDLTQYVDNKQIDLKPNTIKRYYENTLLNRQYVFEILKLTDYNGNHTEPTIHYNKINTFDRFASSFKTLLFPTTLEYAETQITRTPFNYNITNSVLPKLIENIKFNPHHKENHNVKITSDRSKIGFYYDQNKWKAINKNELLDDLCNYSLKILSKYFEEKKESLSDDILSQYKTFSHIAKLKSELRNEIKEKIENIAYIFTKNNEIELDV